jgi:hypothetical protein
VPTLKVKRIITTKSSSPNLTEQSKFDFDDFKDEKKMSTTYRHDYRESGVDVCMAKAYNLLMNKNANSANQSIELKNS